MRNREDYLLVAWEFIESFDTASEKDIADRLGITGATASQYITSLVNDGLLVKNGRAIEFTRLGKRMTAPMVRMHRISEVFAFRFLEVPWEETHSSVMELEHLFSGEKGEKLFKNLGRPETCPHGNPTDPFAPRTGTSAVFAKDGTYRILRVTFEEDALLRKLASVEAFPDRQIRVYHENGVSIETEIGQIRFSPEDVQALILVR
ncbi:MAG: metal-dependent transcriptional regulator [Candidatus Thermoplasmatota archaeon]|nr:metal-dependent transcriptional regulator [Candidatus Thermoplasmatota archaeon]MCL5794579.1 metal-dependent transcriptional regulator [Candidatus Thermoplasmatota archaeon]